LVYFSRSERAHSVEQMMANGMRWAGSLATMQPPGDVLPYEFFGQPGGVRIEITSECVGQERVEITRPPLGDEYSGLRNQFRGKL
jgi:hypothetical protein